MSGSRLLHFATHLARAVLDPNPKPCATSQEDPSELLTSMASMAARQAGGVGPNGEAQANTFFDWCFGHYMCKQVRLGSNRVSCSRVSVGRVGTAGAKVRVG